MEARTASDHRELSYSSTITHHCIPHHDRSQWLHDLLDLVVLREHSRNALKLESTRMHVIRMVRLQVSLASATLTLIPAAEVSFNEGSNKRSCNSTDNVWSDMITSRMREKKNKKRYESTGFVSNRFAIFLFCDHVEAQDKIKNTTN